MAPRSPSPMKKSPPAPRRPRTPRPPTASQIPTTETITADLPGFSRLPEDETAPPTTYPGPDAGEDDPGAPAPAPTPAPPTDDDDGAAIAEPAKQWRPIDPATRAFLYGVAQTALGVVGSILQMRLAHPDRYGPNVVFLPDEQDEQTIGGALANLGARRMPEGLGGDNDAADLLNLAIGTMGYGVKNYIKRAQLVTVTAGGASTLENDAEPVTYASQA